MAAGELGLAVENLRALAAGPSARSTSATRYRRGPCEAVRELAACARELEAYLGGEDPEPARAAAQRAAALANAVLEETGNLSAVHIVGQIRLAAVDLLRATGMERGEAQEAVRSARLTSGEPLRRSTSPSVADVPLFTT